MDDTDTETHQQDGSASAPPRRLWPLPVGRRIAALALVVAMLAAAGVWTATHSTSGSTKAGDDVRRTDLTSLTERMPALTVGRSAVWYSGWVEGQTEPDEPTPTWMDAVVTLPEGRAADLASTYSTTPVRGLPEVVAELEDDVPPGALEASAALDRALSTEYWHATAYLSVSTDTLVLVVEGHSTAH